MNHVEQIQADTSEVTVLVKSEKPSPEQRRDRWISVGFAMLVVLSVAVLFPFAGVPMNDDWSYARTALVFAQTGRIVYNGWSSPMLLPQIAFGALITKLFGFSYLGLDMAGIVMGGVCAALMYHLGRSSGLPRIWSLVIAAVLLTNPISIAIMPSFMTEMPTLALMLGSTLCLVNAIKCDDDGQTVLLWKPLLYSVVLGVVAGSNRQSVWAGLLGGLISVAVLSPKSRRAVLVSLSGSAVAICILSMWFAAQPNTAAPKIGLLLSAMQRFPFETVFGAYKLANIVSLFAAPITIVAMRGRSWRSPVLLAALIVALAGAWTSDPYWNWGNNLDYFTVTGVEVGEVFGHFEVYQKVSMWFASFVRIGGAVAMGCNVYLISEWLIPSKTIDNPHMRQRVISMVALCSSGFHLLAMMPWFSVTRFAFDRYALLILPGVLLALAIVGTNAVGLTKRNGWRLSYYVSGLWLLSLVFGWGYMRYTDARAAAYRFLTDRGIPRKKIDGGIEFNADTQVMMTGLINNQLMTYQKHVPGPKLLSSFSRAQDLCPALEPEFAVTAVPELGFPWPETDLIRTFRYTGVTPPFQRKMYVLRIRSDHDSDGN